MVSYLLLQVHQWQVLLWPALLWAVPPHSPRSSLQLPLLSPQQLPSLLHKNLLEKEEVQTTCRSKP